MYVFVRFNAYVNIVFGVVLMFFGVGAVIYGFAQNAALIDLANNFLLVGTQVRLLDARFYMAILGLLLFLAGMGISASGQLMLVFVDTAAHTRETNALLRGMRKFE